MGLSKEERDRLKAIISDTITLLCRNSIQKFEKDFNVEGLIGITVDSEDLLLVSIKESVRNPNAPVESEVSGSEDVSDGGSSSLTSDARKRKRKRKKRQEGESTPKVARSEYDIAQSSSEYSHTGTPQSHKSANLPQNTHIENSRGSYNGDGGMSNDGSSMISLQEMKYNHSDDDDLIEIIKEEPGDYIGNTSQEQIVAIQSLHPQQHHGATSVMNTSMNLTGAVPAGGMQLGTLPQMPLAPGQTGDLNEQVELMPGSGVHVKRATYNQLQFIDKGSKLVRKLVREIFPDVHLLASSSCMGKGETSPGLDRHKVEVIKDIALARCNMRPAKVTREINWVCGNLRKSLKTKRSKHGVKKA